MADLRVTSRPNYSSQDHYEVLGCASSASRDEITRAYRDLAWKHHPRNRPSDPEASAIFVRLSEAYLSLKNLGSDLETGETGGTLTLRDARRTYENKFGKFRKLYHEEGGIVGLPYSFALREGFEHMGKSHSFPACGRIQVGFLRSWHLKTKIDLPLALMEAILTWGTVAACCVYFLLNDDENEWYLNVVGGVGLILSFCVLSFWYGFTRYPVLVEKDFGAWLRGNDPSRKDMDEIRDVCSEYFHCDTRKRGQTVAIVASAPFMVVDQISASIAITLVSAVVYPLRVTIGVPSATECVFIRGVAKSIGAVLAAIVYYAAWIMGPGSVKVGVVVSLLVNQALYTSILFRMDFLNFLGLQIFRGAISVTVAPSSARKNHALNLDEIKRDVDAAGGETHTSKHTNDGTSTEDESSHGEDGIDVDRRRGGLGNAASTSDSRSGAHDAFSSYSTESDDTDLENVLTFHSLGGETKHDKDSCENCKVVPSSDSYFSTVKLSRSDSAGTASSSQGIEVSFSRDVLLDYDLDETGDDVAPQYELAPPGSRGTKTINFAGEVYSPRVGEMYSPRLEEDDLAEDGQNMPQTAFGVPTLLQGLKNRFHQNVISALNLTHAGKSSSLGKVNIVRSCTLSTATSSSKSEQVAPEFTETVTIVGQVESSEGEGQFNDPRVSNAQGLSPIAELQHETSTTSSKRVLDTIAIHAPHNNGEVPRGGFLPTTSPHGAEEKEVPPPAYVNALEMASRKSILDNPNAYVVADPSLDNDLGSDNDSSTLSSMPRPVASLTVPTPPPPPPPTQHLPPKNVNPSSNGPRIPTQINMLAFVGSVDEEDLTIVGFDTHSPCESPRRPTAAEIQSKYALIRGRRPAPGKVDLPFEPFDSDRILSRSTNRCDQFVF